MFLSTATLYCHVTKNFMAQKVLKITYYVLKVFEFSLIDFSKFF